MPEPGKPDSKDPLDGARRIDVHGVRGSGKTHAATRISETSWTPWTALGQDSLIRRPSRSTGSTRERVAAWEVDPALPRVQAG